MKSIGKLFIIVFSGTVFLSSCKDQKTEQCEKSFNRIKKCFPLYAKNKSDHIKLCKETYKKASTKISRKCSDAYDNCESFKNCLVSGSKCVDFSGKNFDNCLLNAPNCTKYQGNNFKNCLKCVKKSSKPEDLKSCIMEMSGDDDDIKTPTPVIKTPTPVMKTPTPVKSATPVKTTPK
jgi:hypothetical protein